MVMMFILQWWLPLSWVMILIGGMVLNKPLKKDYESGIKSDGTRYESLKGWMPVKRAIFGFGMMFGGLAIQIMAYVLMAYIV